MMGRVLGVLVAAAAPSSAPSPLVEQIDKTGFYAIESPSFARLTPQQHLLGYWLAQAAIAIDPIVYDQLSRAGVREKKLIGALVEKPERLPAASRDPIVKYAKLFFASRGNHNSTTNAKFIPGVSFEELSAAAHAAQKAGAALGTPGALDATLTELKPFLFDPQFEPSPTNKNPPAGQDIVTASSNTFYGTGITLADLKGFTEAYPLNSRVVKDGTALHEDVYRAGTPDGRVTPGLYAHELSQAIEALRMARSFADPTQAKVIDALIAYYQTGEKADWHTFNVAWVQNDAPVDFVNGFIETYRDARAAKGSSEALVSVPDLEVSALMQKLAASALYFEKRAPWTDAYRKLEVKPPVGKAVEAVIETGDFPAAIIGDNLPNEEDIHREYGTKNFLLTNSSDVFNRVRGLAYVREFSPDDLPRYEKVGSRAGLLHTALHEIIGHGSGKSRTKEEPRATLREYYSTLEEARADLMGYWNARDPKLAEAGVADAADVADEMYQGLARSIFGVLNHYPKGDRVEEDHDRDRLMVWNYIAERGGVGMVEKSGKHYGVVLDWEKAHAAVGTLLAELMRIKGEGDHDAIAALVTKYGLHFDPRLRDETVARFAALGLPTYAAGIYGTLELVKDAKTGAEDAVLRPNRDFLAQQLAWARANGTLGF